MKTVYISFAFLIIFSSTSFAQTKPTSITLKNGFFGWQFYQGEEKLAMSEVVNIMESNLQAKTYLKSARTNNTWASIIGSIGGFMLGYPLGVASAGGDANWAMAAVGGGLVVVAIPLSIKANKQARNAVAAYNDGQQSTSFRRTELNIGFTENRFRLILQF